MQVCLCFLSLSYNLGSQEGPSLFLNTFSPTPHPLIPASALVLMASGCLLQGHLNDFKTVNCFEGVTEMWFFPWDMRCSVVFFFVSEGSLL